MELPSPYVVAPRSPSELRNALDRAGLTAPVAQVNSALLYRGWERHLDVITTVGCQYVAVASVSAEEVRALRDWHELATVLNRAGETARRAGVQLTYCQHEIELAAMDGQLPHEVLLAETDPALVSFEMDIYPFARRGLDASHFLIRAKGRVVAVRLRDMDGTSKRASTEIGAGSIDFLRILRSCRSAGVRHYFVAAGGGEPAAMDGTRKSYRYLASLKV